MSAGTPRALSPTAGADLDEAAALLEDIGASWRTQAIGAAARLGLADHLASGPMEVAALAHAAQADAPSLHRLLRALQGLGVVAAGPDGRYALTPRGQWLRGDRAASLKPWALWWSEQLWPLWSELGECVRTGTSARARRGDAGYAHLHRDPDAAAVFHEAMRGITRVAAGEVARVLDLRDAACVIDVGGGHGELLHALLRAHPHLKGIVFDRDDAMPGARAAIATGGLADRCVAVAGDFFVAVPPGADVAVAKSVLHNWDDAACVAILRACRAALPDHGRIVLVERVIPEPPEPPSTGTLRADLNMLIGMGGRERTSAEFDRLLVSAGFGPGRVLPLRFEFSLVEASVAG